MQKSSADQLLASNMCIMHIMRSIVTKIIGIMKSITAIMMTSSISPIIRSRAPLRTRDMRSWIIVLTTRMTSLAMSTTASSSRT